MTTDTKTITVEVDDAFPYWTGNGDDEFTIPVQTAIDLLTAALAKVPERFRDAAVLNVFASGDYAHAYLSVKYDRPETDDERRSREQAQQRYKTEAEARERSEYARLRAKYG